MAYTQEIASLPIGPYLDDICVSLKNSVSRFLVLTAQTGAGKSTALPLALLKHFEGNILMLEPRRLAVLNIATRVSELLGEELGNTCGYAMHLEHKTSQKTRFTVLTEAILTRKLQKDPALEGISVVVIDEFHERSIHADLALAFLKEAMELRDDLYVVVMSATMQVEKLRKYLLGFKNMGADTGTVKDADCPCYSVPGRMFPVEIEYRNDGNVSQAVKHELNSVPKTAPCGKADAGYCTGDILVFLPGIYEIRKVRQELESMVTDGTVPVCEILVLHSSVPISEQRKVLASGAKNGCRRVILSSSIAETSLTVPNVTVVIDSGLCRMNVFNRNLGMQTLVTRVESQFNAEQRAGRAGRTAPGKCIRLWSQNDVRQEAGECEILRSDLVPLVLECAEWGVTSPSGLLWMDEPPLTVWQSSVELLEQLGCLKDGSITDLGRACLELGIHPRLGCVALSGVAWGNFDFSTSLAVSYLQEVQMNERVKSLYAQDLKKRVQNLTAKFDLSKYFPQDCSEFSTACALLCGYPDRIAVLSDVEADRALYQFASGRKAVLSLKSAGYPKYIIAPDVDAGERTGRIFSWEAVADGDAVRYMTKKAVSRREITFCGDSQKIQKVEYLQYGKIVLSKRNLPAAEGDYMQAVCSMVREKSLNSLPLGKNSLGFLQRVQFYIQHKTEAQDLNNEASLGYRFKNLEGTASEWLSPFVPEGSRLNEQNVYNALFYYLDGDRVAESVPTELKLPNGKTRKIVYENQNGTVIPVLEIIIQQIFGCFTTPQVMGQKVLLKLLSPARRPLQITSDLEHFWQETWPQICSEMKGRYPKHNWDWRIVQEDI